MLEDISVVWIMVWEILFYRDFILLRYREKEVFLGSCSRFSLGYNIFNRVYVGKILLFLVFGIFIKIFVVVNRK